LQFTSLCRDEKVEVEKSGMCRGNKDAREAGASQKAPTSWSHMLACRCRSFRGSSHLRPCILLFVTIPVHPLYVECRLLNIFDQVSLSGLDWVHCLVYLESFWILTSFVANIKTNDINIRSQLYALVSTAYTTSHLSDNILQSSSYSYGIRNP
jgi:hypothetical protein